MEENLKDFVTDILGKDSEIVIEILKHKTERNFMTHKLALQKGTMKIIANLANCFFCRLVKAIQQ